MNKLAIRGSGSLRRKEKNYALQIHFPFNVDFY